MCQKTTLREPTEHDLFTPAKQDPVWLANVQKTRKNIKNHHISAGKHPFDTSKVLQVCQLLCSETQTSEHGTKGSFVFAIDFRAFDVEVIPQRREILQGRHVPNHIGVGELEKFQLPEILQSLDVAGDLGVFQFEARQLLEILQRLNVTRDLGFSEVEFLQVRQFAEARTQGAGELPVLKQIDLHHFAVLPRLRDPPDVVEGPTWSRLC